ncbi:MAG: DUF6607 family protein [Luteibaculum sp.]
MNKLFSICTLMSLSIAAMAQNAEKLAQDREAILNMEGCYKVEFRYAEVYSPDTGYKFHDREYSWAYEWITPIQVSDDFISLQHLLTVNDSTVVKHWRQDWVYEAPSMHEYVLDYTWQRAQNKNNQGQWKQVVTQVDDSPRYEGSGTWIHVDGKHYWESEAPAPLPRREISTAKRTDYNLMLRNNRQEITEYGWVHDQNNQKIQVNKDGSKELIAVEKGWNTYTKVDEKTCQPAIDYWKKTERFWSHVRSAWAEIKEQHDKFHLEVKNEHGVIFMSMFRLAEESMDWKDAKMKKEIAKVIDLHLVTNQDEIGQKL